MSRKYKNITFHNIDNYGSENNKLQERQTYTKNKPIYFIDRRC
jgi:hypothetical protein